MLTKEDNELVSRVGPGTPVGNLMREYWVPALLSSELPEPDCDPVRVLLLGEKLIAFRDSHGRVGLMDHSCPHRGGSLFYARNEQCGLRCVYHGWKFDVNGTCLEMPNEPAESNFKNKIKATAYPCVERGGIVWTYMGQRSTPPPLPNLEANMLPDGEYQVSATLRECNWLQGLEGDIDTCHFGFLHFGGLNPDDAPPGTFLQMTVKDRAPRYEVVDTEGGAMYTAYRPADTENTYYRIAQFLFPFYVLIPTSVLGLQVLARAWVPMDDEHMMFFGMNKRGRSPRLTNGPGERTGYELLPNTTDWLGRFRLVANAENDFLIDRAKQRQGDFTGVAGISTQDAAITESMGPIYNRSKEHLGTSDAMIIRVRRRIMAAARELADHGIAPPGVDNPEAYAVRSGGVILPSGSNWVAATEDLRKAFVDHPELDLAISGTA